MVGVGGVDLERDARLYRVERVGKSRMHAVAGELQHLADALAALPEGLREEVEHHGGI